MAGNGANRVVCFVLFAACSALCQQGLNPAQSLPDAPSAQTWSLQNSSLQASKATQRLRAFSDTGRLPVDTAGDRALRFDPGHFADEEQRAQREDDGSARAALLFRRSSSYHGATSNSFWGRAGYAASSIVLTRDDEGRSRLNTPYLLTVLTSAVAHSAYRPYWRRSATQPFSDFGATIGSDAGMNVFHEFKPGIMQLVKSHQPRFVSRIEEKVGR
jgi:hypothetical protein